MKKRWNILGNGTIKKKQDLKFRDIIFPTEKQRRETRFNLSKKIANYLFYLILFIASIYFIFLSDYFAIKNIKVENVKSIEIEDYVKMTLQGKNILFMMPGRYLKELIEKFPVLEEARIVRGLPNTVRVIVDERKQKLIWCNSSGCFEVDNNGYIFEETVKGDKDVVLRDLSNVKVNYLDKVVSKQFINFFINALEGFDKIGIKIEEAQIDQTTFKVDFVTEHGWKVIMDSGGNLENQLFAVEQVMNNNRSDIKEYVDVRVEGVAFIK